MQNCCLGFSYTVMIFKFFFCGFLLFLPAELDQDRLKLAISYPRHALCSQQNPGVLQLTISISALQNSACSESVVEQQQKNEGSQNVCRCLGLDGELQLEELEAVSLEKAGSVFPQCVENMSDTQGRGERQWISLAVHFAKTNLLFVD